MAIPVSQEKRSPQTRQIQLPTQTRFANSYYGILGLHPSASALEIRRSYRKLSKRYHPDTTELPQVEAKTKFQKLNEAYGTLSNPERRSLYDLKIGYSRVNVIQAPLDIHGGNYSFDTSKSAYLDPTDRPLSAGETFALFILGLTFIACLLVAIVVGLVRGDAAIQISTTGETFEPPIQFVQSTTHLNR